MKKILLAVGLCAVMSAQAAIINNASFETGNYNPEWSWYKRWVFGTYPDGLGTSSGSPTQPTVSVVTSDGSLNPFYGPSTYFTPDSGGNYFVKITTGAANQHQGISQSFTLTSPTAIYGWYTAGSSGSPTITVNITDDLGFSVGLKTFSSTPMTWQEWNFGTLAAGDYTIYFDVYGTSAGWTGYFDMSVVPEPRGWLMGGALVAVAGLANLIRNRRKQKTAA